MAKGKRIVTGAKSRTRKAVGGFRKGISRRHKRRASAATPGTFASVDPKGTYLRFDPSDKPNKATTISLSSLKLSPDDYIGLESEGNFSPGTGLPQNATLGGVFLGSGAKAYVAPADFGNQRSFDSVNLWPSGQNPNIQEDFTINGAQQYIVRIPQKARSISLMGNDSFFKDNTASRYGVWLTRPNSPPIAKHAKQSRRKIIDNVDCGGFESDEEVWAFVQQQKATGAPPRLSAVTTPAPAPQLRGWYGTSNRWYPEQSKFRAARPNHQGVDIFAPASSTLMSAVGPARLKFYPGGSATWGNYLALTFKKNRRVYVLVYAHLEGFIGADNRTVNAGDAIAIAGCTGNAGRGEPCGFGKGNACGGRSDHVHVELMADKLSNDLSSRIDPVSFFGWSLKYYNDKNQPINC